MIYFVSDVHLGFQNRNEDKMRETLFINFLKKIQDNCTQLFLLGDIFDYWFEYKTVIPAYFYRTLTIFHNFIEAGIKIEYLMGNHDFGHLNFFRNELGIDVIKHDIERELYGKKFYLSHGDGKSYNDQYYLMLRRILRNQTCQKLYSKLHPDCGIYFALNSSRKSRKYTNNKKYGDSDGMHDFARKKLEEGFDYVIMGHRHLAEVCIYNEKKYINLGEWLAAPHYGKFDGTKFELIKVQEE